MGLVPRGADRFRYGLILPRACGARRSLRFQTRPSFAAGALRTSVDSRHLRTIWRLDRLQIVTKTSPRHHASRHPYRSLVLFASACGPIVPGWDDGTGGSQSGRPSDDTSSTSDSGLDHTADDSTGPIPPDVPPAPASCSTVDILFVIDNSLSMSEYQNQLALAWPAFVDQMATTLPIGTSLHVGMTTTSFYDGECSEASIDCMSTSTPKEVDAHVILPTDGSTQGNGYQGRLFTWDGLRFFESTVGGDDADLKAWFSEAAVAAGEEGCSYEVPTAAAGFAFHPANIGANREFARTGGVLTIVVVTDEPDKTQYGSLMYREMVIDAGYDPDAVVTAGLVDPCIAGTGDTVATDPMRSRDGCGCLTDRAYDDIEHTIDALDPTTDYNVWTGCRQTTEPKGRVHLELVPPGEVAQLDFGKLGLELVLGRLAAAHEPKVFLDRRRALRSHRTQPAKHRFTRTTPVDRKDLDPWFSVGASSAPSIISLTHRSHHGILVSPLAAIANQVDTYQDSSECADEVDERDEHANPPSALMCAWHARGDRDIDQLCRPCDRRRGSPRRLCLRSRHVPALLRNTRHLRILWLGQVPRRVQPSAREVAVADRGVPRASARGLRLPRKL